MFICFGWGFHFQALYRLEEVHFCFFLRLFRKIFKKVRLVIVRLNSVKSVLFSVMWQRILSIFALFLGAFLIIIGILAFTLIPNLMQKEINKVCLLIWKWRLSRNGDLCSSRKANCFAIRDFVPIYTQWKNLSAGCPVFGCKLIKTGWLPRDKYSVGSAQNERIEKERKENGKGRKVRGICLKQPSPDDCRRVSKTKDKADKFSNISKWGNFS